MIKCSGKNVNDTFLPVFFPVIILLVLPFASFSQVPVADFSSDIVSGCKPIVVKFTDKSSGNTTGWSWDLGNGTLSNAQSPTTTYLEAGKYEVKLVAINASGSDTLIRTNYITVFDLPAIEFFTNDSGGCAPLFAHFTDRSNGAGGSLTKWEWAFGDGDASNAQNPDHTYTNTGTYNVSLTATNSNGCSNVGFKPQYIKVGGPLQADFSYSVSPYCNAPVQVFFSNLSNASDSLAHVWMFGDGGTGSDGSPTHNYDSFGNFNVSLVSISPSGCSDTITKVVTLAPKFVDFSGPDIVCGGVPDSFFVTSNPTPLFVSWKMGDSTTYNTFNIGHTYDTSGLFTITLINDFGGCIDSVSKTIEVKYGPVASFTSSDTAGCKAPYTVDFINQSNGGVSQVWDFGDQATSVVRNSTHIYKNEGNYTVSLKTTDATGCTSTAIKSGFIKILSPSVRLKGVPANGCAPYSFAPSYVVTHVDPVKSYFWSFGDGTTSTDSLPVHLYPVPGSYTISLIVTTAGGCTDTVTVVNGVKVSANTANSFDFNIDTPSVCVHQNVTFTPIVTGSNLAFKWYFGDNIQSGMRNPVHNYADTGAYTVRLDISFAGCTSSVIKKQLIRVTGPVSGFTFAKDCTDPGKVIFTNLSKNSLTTLWDFGDGSTSTDSNAVHTYTAAGDYIVKLISGNMCNDTFALPVPIWLDRIQLASGSNDVCKADSILFTVVHPQADAVLSYYYNFSGNLADGFIAGSDTVKYPYNASGNYKVTAYTADKYGCKDTAVLAALINVHGPTARFEVANNFQCANQAIDFIDSSISAPSAPITDWTWNFGDGTIQSYTSPPFSHTYTLAGRYPVTLLVKDKFGCTDSLKQADFVTSYYAKADFLSIDSLGCPGKGVRFTDRSIGPVFRRVWDFGDGNISNDVNPVHAYAASGTYTVKLVIYSAGGCSDSVTKTNYISLNYPKAAFSLSDSIATCPPLQVNFTDSSQYVLTYLWSLGDGSISSTQNPAANYFLPGNYRVKLIVTSPGGCKDSAFASILIAGPNGVISYSPTSGCVPVPVVSSVRTTGAVHFTWDFGDGFTVEGPDSSSSHIYSSGGKFLPKVLIENLEGCNVPIIGTDTVFVESLQPTFGANTTGVCDTASVYFADSSISTGTLSYKWYFGDGAISTAKNPSHSYPGDGKYSVKLVITSSLGCSDSVTYPNFIEVFKLPQPSIIAPAKICAGSVVFSAQVVPDPVAPAVDYKWVFGNNDSSLLANPPAQQFAAGTYTNTLSVTNSKGCAATVSKPLTVEPLPVLILSNDTTICLGDTIQLTVSGATNYVWKSVGNSFSCSACDNPFVYPKQNTVYQVTGTSAVGCVSQDSVVVKVMNPFTVQAATAYDICDGKSIQISASGAPLYLWSPSAGLSSANIPDPTASPSATTVYLVTGYDSLGCFTDTANVIVNVNSYPTVELGNDIIASVQTKIILNPVVSNNVVSYAWTPSSYLTCSNCRNPEATATTNITYRLTVTSDRGCSADDTVRLIVTCDNSAIYIPNTFSPNGDGTNDIFYIRAKGVSAVHSFRIINRVGETVFEKRYVVPNDVAAGWDGTFKGQKSESGVYIYHLEVSCSNNQILKYSGNITLIR